MYIIILIIILILFYISQNKEPFFSNFAMSIDAQDSKIHRYTPWILNKILKDIDPVFREFKIHYWADGSTLLGLTKYRGFIPGQGGADLCILHRDEFKLLSIAQLLNEMGYKLVRYWAGYKVVPVGSINLKYINRTWLHYEVDNEIEDREWYDYGHPNVNIHVCNIFGDIVHYHDKYLRKVLPNYYHYARDLFPTIAYNYNDHHIDGPYNPIPYIERAFGNKLALGYLHKIDRDDNLDILPLLKDKFFDQTK